MASISRAIASLPIRSYHHSHNRAFVSTAKALNGRINLRVVRALTGGDSYLDMWKNAVDRERKEAELQNLIGNFSEIDGNSDDFGDRDLLEKRNEEFKKILDVSTEERDRVQRMQVIDRAAAAIAAARSVLKNKVSPVEDNKYESLGTRGVQEEGTQNEGIFISRSETSGNGTPGPDFWSWAPPEVTERSSNDLQRARKSSVLPTSINPVMEKDPSGDFLTIPYESKVYESNRNPLLPPFQSLIEVDKVEVSDPTIEKPSSKEEQGLLVQFSVHAAEAAHALQEAEKLSSSGVNPDGSRWWRDTGMERRPDGVICRWTMTRGVSADEAVEWQDKYWEASDEFGYKELGSEKLGRDAVGNVWSEHWTESMLQERGLLHLEKTAEKWGKNGAGGEWQEKWWEHYDGSGQAEKWAHKWCSIDPNTPLEAGHAHVWHERWGEKYDGHGGSMKYTDKWAERREGDGWTKWGDKWDEHFDPNCHGVKQGETWWEGKHGERWNRTWGEGHNGSGWVHKYGKSSSGEHWDTYAEQDTWYERFPHYGFYHCFDNSVQLRQVKKPSEMNEQ